MSNFDQMICRSILGVIFFIGTVSCDNYDSAYLNVQCNNTQGFSMDSITKKMAYATVENDKYLTLTTLNVPSDTFCLRIEYYKNLKVNIFEYKNYKSFIQYKKYVFNISNDREGKILFDKYKESKEEFSITFNPSIKGKDFLYNLQKNKILELPDCLEIKSYPFDVDYIPIRPVYFEYLNKCRYKIFHYNDPYSFSNKFIEAGYVTGFMDYLKSEFNF